MKCLMLLGIVDNKNETFLRTQAELLSCKKKCGTLCL